MPVSPLRFATETLHLGCSGDLLRGATKTPPNADICSSSPLSAPANNMLKQMTDLVRTIPAERELWLKKMRTLEPSAEEKHRLEWMISRLETELKKLSRLTEATQRDSAVIQQSMEEVDGTFSSIKREQEEDKVKIQSLLALCQPITPGVFIDTFIGTSSVAFFAVLGDEAHISL